MALEDLHWIDWIGLALAAYGLAAGAVRGLTQQFSRWTVWLVALLFAGAATPVGDWLAGVFGEGTEQLAALKAWMQVGMVLLAVLLLGGLRRLLVGPWEGPGGVGDRLLGLICGAGTALVIWLLVFGTAEHALDVSGLDEAGSRPWAEKLTLGYDSLPEAIRSPLLDL